MKNIKTQFFILNVYSSIKKLTPNYVRNAIHKLIPLAFVSSVFDVFGLFIIFPVINIILDSSIIYENKYLSFLYKELGFNSEMQFAAVLLGVILLFFVLKNFVVFYISDKQAQLAYSVGEKLAVHQFEDFLKKPYQFHTAYKKGDLLRSVIEIPFNFVTGVLLPFVVIINELIVAVLIALSIIFYNPLLFFSVLLFIVPLFSLYTYFQRKKLRHVSLQRDSSHSEMFVKGKQGLEGFREITVFNKVNYFKPKFEESVRNYSLSNSQLYLYNTYSPRVVEGIAVLSIFIILLSGVGLKYDLSKVASFLGAFSLAAYRLIPSVNKMILSYNIMRASDFVFNHFSENPINDEKIEAELRDNENMSCTPFDFNEKIEFENVSFKYSEGSEKIVNQVNLIIRKGETVGIIGESGSGKTTLLNIFLMLLKQDAGNIKIDKITLTNDLKHRWFKTISYVPQNVVIISGTIQENIAFGVPEDEVDRKKLEEAIENSQLKDMIDNFPAGLYTKIDDRGLSISGGQRQRIGIARALYHNGQILVFDEATSSLDRETERILTESIKVLSDQKYTIVIVAHRLETLKYCDKIYRLEKGQIGEPICFDEIMLEG